MKLLCHEDGIATFSYASCTTFVHVMPGFYPLAYGKMNRGMLMYFTRAKAAPNGEKHENLCFHSIRASTMHICSTMPTRPCAGNGTFDFVKFFILLPHITLHHNPIPSRLPLRCVINEWRRRS